jgi:ABC-type lipoprotein release transport system permease subunit
VAATAAMLATASLANLIPARRAACVDPMQALRTE